MKNQNKNENMRNEKPKDKKTSKVGLLLAGIASISTVSSGINGLKTKDSADALMNALTSLNENYEMVENYKARNAIMGPKQQDTIAQKTTQNIKSGNTNFGESNKDEASEVLLTEVPVSYYESRQIINDQIHEAQFGSKPDMFNPEGDKGLYHNALNTISTAGVSLGAGLAAAKLLGSKKKKGKND